MGSSCQEHELFARAVEGGTRNWGVCMTRVSHPRGRDDGWPGELSLVGLRCPSVGVLGFGGIALLAPCMVAVCLQALSLCNAVLFGRHCKVQ